jgi:hypothetical protein
MIAWFAITVLFMVVIAVMLGRDLIRTWSTQ